MFYENYYQTYEQQEQNRKAAKCEQKFIDLCNKCRELNDLCRQHAQWCYNAFYMQAASLQNDILKKQAEWFWTWNELRKKYSGLDARHKQVVLQHCWRYTALSCSLNLY